MSLKDLRSFAASLLVVLSSCGALPEDESVSQTESALLANISYKVNNAPLQTNGNTDVSAVIFNNALFYAFVRRDTHISTIIDTNLVDNGGQTFTTANLPDTTNFGPSLIVYNNVLHVAYVGTDGALYIRRSSDGTSWTEPVVKLDPGPNWRFAPTLNVWNGGLRVFAAVTGNSALWQIDLNSPTDSPVTVVGSHFTGESTNDTPSSTTWNGDLYLSWAGTASGKPIYVKHFHDGTGWTVPSIVTGAAGRPSLYPTSLSRLTIIYRGNDTNIYSVGSSNGTSFGNSTRNSATSDHNPSGFKLANDGTIWAAYSGRDTSLYTYPMFQ